MCMFAGPVQHVASTNIFANMRAEGPGRWRQSLVYEAQVGTVTENAMVLPIPVHRQAGAASIELLNLSGVPDFFTRLLDLLEKPAVVPGFGPMLAKAMEPPLPVHRVGSFDVSIVPTIADFARLSGIFRLGLGALGPVLQQRYADHAFVVYQIAPGNGSLHPFGVSFVTRYDHLFFPTLHVHDTTAPPAAHFDHRLFAQRSTLPEPGGRPSEGSRWQIWGEHVPFVEANASIESWSMYGSHANQDSR